MKNQKFILNLVISILFLLILGNQAVISNSIPQSTENNFSQKSVSLNNIANGSIEGTNITYSYGTRTFTDIGNFTATDQGIVSESISEQRLERLTLPLVDASTFNWTDTLYEIEVTRISSLENVSEIRHMNNATFWWWVDFFTNTTGYSIDKVIDNYTTTEATLMTRGQEFLGTFELNVTYVEISFDSVIDNLDANITWIIYPKAMIVSVDRVWTEVDLNITIAAQSTIQYFSYYSVDYDVEVNEWFAQIRDGTRMFLQVSAFENLNLNYTEIRWSKLWYAMHALVNVTLSNITDGSEIPFESYPFSLRPTFFRTNGTIEELDIRQINLQAISTTNSILQAFHAKYRANLNNINLTAQTLVAWMVRSTPRLIAYQDGNLDGQLNLELDPKTGLRPSEGDFIPYIGVTEAYRGEVYHISTFNHTFDEQKITVVGFELVNNTQKDVNVYFDRETEYRLGLGSINAIFTQHPYWNNPVVDDSKKVIFDFGITYENFPVTWYNTSDGGNLIVPMNITNAYIYEIDPINGKSELSPSITFSSLEGNQKAMDAVTGLSLATIYRSDYMSFFGLTAQRTRGDRENLTSSRTGRFTEISFAGPENEFSSIDHSGDKQWYTLDGAGPYQTNVSALNLLSVSASAIGGNLTIFESEIDMIAGSAYLETTEVAKSEFKYRKDLILVSYPIWDGNEIIHDPTYSSSYVSGPPESEPSTPITTSTGYTTTTSPSIVTTTPTDNLTSISNFVQENASIMAVLLAIPLVGLLIRERRQK